MARVKSAFESAKNAYCRTIVKISSNDFFDLNSLGFEDLDENNDLGANSYGTTQVHTNKYELLKYKIDDLFTDRAGFDALFEAQEGFIAAADSLFAAYDVNIRIIIVAGANTSETTNIATNFD